jgi:hypothetical protein
LGSDCQKDRGDARERGCQRDDEGKGGKGMIFRLSQKLATKLKLPLTVCARPDPNPFADWSAHLFTAVAMFGYRDRSGPEGRADVFKIEMYFDMPFFVTTMRG